MGLAKSTVAAEAVNTRLKHLGVNITPHVGKVQDKGHNFYASFNIIVAGLDNIPARRWLNSLVHDLVK